MVQHEAPVRRRSDERGRWLVIAFFGLLLGLQVIIEFGETKVIRLNNGDISYFAQGAEVQLSCINGSVWVVRKQRLSEGGIPAPPDLTPHSASRVQEELFKKHAHCAPSTKPWRGPRPEEQ